MSDFAVEVVPVQLTPHPDPETTNLSVVHVDGYTVCVRTQDWLDKELGAYIPPDSICPDTPMFAFLGDKKLIRARKLRGVPSFGLLVPAPEGAQPGDNVADILGITHWNPVSEDTPNTNQQKHFKDFSEDDSAPQGYIPVYDLQNGRKYNRIFEEGELVHITEKLNGENFRCKYDATAGQMKVASHYRWKKLNLDNTFWNAMWNTPGLEQFCRDNPDCTVYGESVGKVKGYKYGVSDGKPRVYVFDVLQNGQWLDYDVAKSLVEKYNVAWVPAIAESIPYNFEQVCEMVEGKSLIPGATNIREGGIVQPVKERIHPKYGRVKLKFVSLAYLAGKV